MREMSSHKDALILSKSLGKISDDNLIHYFAQELSLIGEGQRAKNLLPDSVIHNFVRLGLLEQIYISGVHTLTDRARDVIQKVSVDSIIDCPCVPCDDFHRCTERGKINPETCLKLTCWIEKHTL